MSSRRVVAQDRWPRPSSPAPSATIARRSRTSATHAAICSAAARSPNSPAITPWPTSRAPRNSHLAASSFGHDASNLLSRSLGNELFVNVDTSDHLLTAGDALLLCSDGLYRSLSVSDMASAVSPKQDLSGLGRRDSFPLRTPGTAVIMSVFKSSESSPWKAWACTAEDCTNSRGRRYE